MLCQCGSEARGEPIEIRSAVGIIDDVLGADDLSGHVTGTAQTINQSQIDCLFTGPDQTGKKLGIILQSLTPSLFNHLDKLLMDVFQ